HTDAKPYSGTRGYTNWDLSADRANAARRALEEGGLAATKIARVVGLASSVLFDRENPHNPINRRISIIVMTKSAEARALSTDAPDVDVAREQIESGAIRAAVGAMSDVEAGVEVRVEDDVDAPAQAAVIPSASEASTSLPASPPPVQFAQTPAERARQAAAAAQAALSAAALMAEPR